MSASVLDQPTDRRRLRWASTPMASSTGDGSRDSDEQADPGVGGDAGPVEAEQHGLRLDAVDAEAHEVGESLGRVAVGVHAVERRPPRASSRSVRRLLRGGLGVEAAIEQRRRPPRRSPRWRPPARGRPGGPAPGRRRAAAGEPQAPADEQRARRRSGRPACGPTPTGGRRPRSSKAIGTRPAAWAASTWTSTPRVPARARPPRRPAARCPPRGCPTARARSAVSGRTAASSSSGSTRPWRSTPTTRDLAGRLGRRAGPPSARRRPAPGGVPRSAAPQQAAAMASVAPLVNTTDRGRAPRSAATCSRAVLDGAPAPPCPRRGSGRGRRPAVEPRAPSRRGPRAAAARSTRGRGSAASLRVTRGRSGRSTQR